jgi:hypothetical protein
MRLNNNSSSNNNNTKSVSLRGLRTHDVTAASCWHLQYEGFSANVYLSRIRGSDVMLLVYRNLICVIM